MFSRIVIFPREETLKSNLDFELKSAKEIESDGTVKLVLDYNFSFSSNF